MTGICAAVFVMILMTIKKTAILCDKYSIIKRVFACIPNWMSSSAFCTLYVGYVQ